MQKIDLKDKFNSWNDDKMTMHFVLIMNFCFFFNVVDDDDDNMNKFKE